MRYQRAFLFPKSRRIFTPQLAAILLALLLASGCAKAPLPTLSGDSGKATSRAALVKTARTQIGVRYKNGGDSPASGFDCSGFVCWVYGQNGISVPRTTREQVDYGRAISRQDLQPGDLVVFKISLWQGLHTGIYTGKGKFIHSPSKGKSVREDALSDPYWQKSFSTARRIL